MTVILYTMPGCGPCKTAARAMTASGIAFEVRDMRDHADEIKALGYRSAPVTIAGADHWSGFRPDLIAKLKEGMG